MGPKGFIFSSGGHLNNDFAHSVLPVCGGQPAHKERKVSIHILLEDLEPLIRKRRLQKGADDVRMLVLDPSPAPAYSTGRSRAGP